VYTATEAFMLTDYSPGYADTWEALDRRLQDVAAIGKLTGKVISFSVCKLSVKSSTYLMWDLK